MSTSLESELEELSRLTRDIMSDFRLSFGSAKPEEDRLSCNESTSAYSYGGLFMGHVCLKLWWV